MLGATADDLMRIATERTGLADFGDDGFLPAFRRMVESINADSVFSDAGREQARERFLKSLVNRLRFAEDVKRHPEILDEQILPPLVILGLPRTGSTKVHRMLWQGGDFTGMLMWQGFNPAPFPDVPADGGEDPRIAAAARFLDWRSSRHAAISKAHHAEAQQPEEEIYLLELSFGTWAPYGYYEMPAYIEWVRHADRGHVYRYLRQLLQYLQWQHHRGAPPKRWILKAPPHLGREADLVAAFPGAKLVLLHREILEVIPSLISLTNAMRHQYCAEAPDKQALSAWIMDEFSDSMRRHMAWRQTQPSGTVLDIAYADIVNDEMAVARRIYDFCGMTMSAQAEAGMRAWSADNVQHGQGAHVYDLQGTGLTDQTILDGFAAYRTAFAAWLKPAELAA